MKIKKIFITSMLFLSVTFFLPSLASANATLDAAIKQFGDFDIRGALKKFKQLEQDATLPQNEKVKVWLYIAMSYVYLRRTPEAETYFKKALRADPQITLPSGSPKRMRKLFEKVKSSVGSGGGSSFGSGSSSGGSNFGSGSSSGGSNFGSGSSSDFGSGSNTGGGSVPPPPPERRAAPAYNPPPEERQPSNSMNFGDFSTRKEPPKPRKEESFNTEPTPRRDIVNPPITPKKKEQDPELSREFNKVKQKKTGGIPLVVTFIAAGAGVALAGAGIYFGMSASGLADNAKKPETLQIDVPLMEKDAKGQALLANVFYSGAGVALAAAVVFFFMRPQAAPAQKVAQNSPTIVLPTASLNSSQQTSFSLSSVGHR